jgi:type IV pilus assembly protein PilP
MMKKEKYIIVLLLVVSLFLTGCAQRRHMRELEQYVAKLKADAANNSVKPLTGLETPIPVIYTAKNLRSPFETSMSTKSHIAGESPLQTYPMAALDFKGTVTEGDKTWGFIETPDKKLYQVKLGDMIGDHYGKITDISPSSIVIKEKTDQVLPLGKINYRIVTLRLKEPSQ